MFDMHTHILAGMDDGAADIANSVEMLRLAWDSGTSHLLASPHVIKDHWFPAWEKIVEAAKSLNEAARKEHMRITVIPGAEVYMQMDILAYIKEPGPYCINGGRYMLVELPSTEIPGFADEFLFTLRTRDITPVLAHPERHPVIARHPEILCKWIEQGVLTQINAPSITGRMGERIMRTAELLLSSNMVHCIGSDAHGIERRRPMIAEAAEKIIQLTGPGRAKELLRDNPQKIIAGLEPESLKILLTKSNRRHNWFMKLFS